MTIQSYQKSEKNQKNKKNQDFADSKWILIFSKILFAADTHILYIF